MSKRSNGTTKALIDAALEADDQKTMTAEALANVKGQAAQAIAAAKADDDAAAAAVAAAHQAVYDDLTADGAAIYISANAEPTYFVATPVEPDDFSLTEIRVA